MCRLTMYVSDLIRVTVHKDPFLTPQTASPGRRALAVGDIPGEEVVSGL